MGLGTKLVKHPMFAKLIPLTTPDVPSGNVVRTSLFPSASKQPALLSPLPACPPWPLLGVGVTAPQVARRIAPANETSNRQIQMNHKFLSLD